MLALFSCFPGNVVHEVIYFMCCGKSCRVYALLYARTTCSARILSSRLSVVIKRVMFCQGEHAPS